MSVDQLDPALQQFLTEFKRVASAIVDSYFVVDSERRIVDFNRAFFALLPRQVARGLKGRRCYEVIELNICKSECIAQQCWADNRHNSFWVTRSASSVRTHSLISRPSRQKPSRRPFSSRCAMSVR